MLKLSENPPILYPESVNLEELEHDWWVAHTKSRNEKALAWSLAKWGIAYFLPLIEKTTKRNNRVFRSLMPLFSGYLFFNGTDEDRYQALTTNRIANIIPVSNPEIFTKELTAIHQAIVSGANIDPHPNMKEGDRCRVIGGPLMGCEGLFIQKKSGTRLLLQVDILGQGAAVEIDGDLLEPI